MSAAIESIQEQTYDADVSLTDIVSRAVSLSSLLRLKPLTLWLRHELSGYPDNEAVPVYRRGMSANLVIRKGDEWVQAPISKAVREKVGYYDQRASISEVELAVMPGRRHERVYATVIPAKQKALRKLTRMDATFHASVSPESNSHVISALRAAIGFMTQDLLDLGLDQESMIFSEQDRLKALALNDRLEDYFLRAHARATENEAAKSFGRFFRRVS